MYRAAPGPLAYAPPPSAAGYPPAQAYPGAPQYPPAPQVRRVMGAHTIETPARKQSKWSPEEDALIIELRGSGMKWEDISRRLPGRSAISCRLHYQNYLERRSEWDEERKNKLARLYERFKPEMWAKVAEELQVPWRAAEAMHWQLGELDMARRAGVVPFSLAPSVGSDAPHFGAHHISPPRSYHYPHSSVGSYRDMEGPPSPRYRSAASLSLGLIPPPPTPPPPGARPYSSARWDYVPSRPIGPEQGDYFGTSGSNVLGQPGLPPIQAGMSSRSGMLPGVAELTTGVSPYSTPAYSAGLPSVSPVPSHPGSPGQVIPPQGYPNADYSSTPKRRASPDYLPREARRRHLDHRYDENMGR